MIILVGDVFFVYVLDVEFFKVTVFSFKDWIWEFNFSLVGMKKLKYFKTKHLVGLTFGSLDYPR